MDTNNIDKYIDAFLAQGTFVMCVAPSKESENAIPVSAEMEFFKNEFDGLDLKIKFKNSTSTIVKMDFCTDGDKNLLSMFYKNTPKEETDTYKAHYGHLLIELPKTELNYPLIGSYTNHDRDTKGKVHIYKEESDVLRTGSDS